MRNISFTLTTRQFLDGSKTVTRRRGWAMLRPGTLLQAVEKSQGLRKGEKVRKLGVILVLDVRQEMLRDLCGSSYGDMEASREGFPEMLGEEFADMFCRHMNCGREAVVTRIEFERVEEGHAP